MSGKRAEGGRTGRHVRTQQPYRRPGLADEIVEDDGVRKVPREKQRDKVRAAKSKSEHGESAEMTERIVSLAREQEQELHQESAFGFGSATSALAASSTADDDFSDASSIAESEADVGFEISPEEDAAFSQFLNPSGPRVMLGDLIAEQLAGLQRPSKDAQFETTSSLSPKVLEVYREVGVFMSSYRSGKVPKPFKILPSLSNWEEILFVTEPDKWTPAAMFVATRLFASNLNESGACKFYSYILVPRCRLDIEENGRLNFHLYHALKKATYKPGAFFKGIILPLCTAGDCSLKEAVIFGSVMKKVSIPVLHSAAAMVKMSGMSYSPCQSIFFATLLDKKYSLPMRVIRDVLEHINVSSNDERALPLKWHLMVLTFVQRYSANSSRCHFFKKTIFYSQACRYKQSLLPEHREQLKIVLRKQNHPSITAEVRFWSSPAWDAEFIGY